MTLHDLTEELAPHFPASTQKDLKTAVRVLAQALNYADAKSCPIEACVQPLPTIYRAVEIFLTAEKKGPHTIRNTKNNLSRLFRLATSKGMLSLTPPAPTRRFKFRDVPLRNAQGPYWRMDGSHLPRHAWPPDVESAYIHFYTWASAPLVDGRPAAWKKRPTTLKGYELLFSTYFDYLHHELHISPVQFDHLFDFSLIERFVSWHINEKWHRPTRTAEKFVNYIKVMAVQYRPNPTLVTALKALYKRLPRVTPILNKSDAWVPLHEIERVGVALWPTKSLETVQRYYCATHPNKNGAGRVWATRTAVSLMLRLWVHIPYRQRNMREMKLDHNLYRTPEGQWRIRFAGEELKVATKRGLPNVFDLPFPPSLIPTLESYLQDWRPVLSQITNAPEVFLDQYGRGFAAHNIRRTLRGHIYSFTGRRWHPHIMRTIWATEWISSGGDFMTAAIMLNDRLETVIKNYSHLRDENVAENAYQWVQSRVNHH